MVNNVRGIKTKMTTIKRIIEEERPVMIALVETKLMKDDNLEIPGYKVERADRDEEGGGVLVAIRKSLQNIWVITKEYKKHDCEMLWLKMNNNKSKVKIGVVYMPQESRTKVEILREIYSVIEEEVREAAAEQYGLLLVGDLNCKVGDERIQGNLKKITTGGRLLNSLIKRNNLAIGNAQNICKGLWTRIEGNEKSVLDYVITFKDDVASLMNMEIDEEKTITPYHIDTVTNERKYTDHCMITGQMDLLTTDKPEPKYVKIITEKGWTKFRKEMEEKKVSNLVDERCIKTTYKEWSDTVRKIHEGCKVKVKRKRPWKVSRKLIAEKKSITRSLKEALLGKEQIKLLKLRLKSTIEQIEEEEHKHEYQRLCKQVDDIKRGGGTNSNAFWKARSRLLKRPDEIVHCMTDKNGKLCDDPEEIKEIHRDWYKELLTTREGETEAERTAEEVVKQLWRSMEVIAEGQPPRTTSTEEIEAVVKNLDVRKAKDNSNWNYKIIKEGGKEMIASLKNIINKVDEQRIIPEEWQQMDIKVTHKKGNRTLMSNKRGLFMTSNISKVYERVVKERNSDAYRAGISEWANGGLKQRAAIDNVMIMMAIIEQNQYLKRNTFLTFTDAEKCFDKLWLEDGIFELWRGGTDIRDCYMIKRLNESAKVVVRTPVGNTETIHLENIVRQGSVYGPPICTSSMDKINYMGKDIATPYGPNMTIRAVSFVDDVNGAGGGKVADNLISNCNLMEERKKMTFSTKNSKTEYMIIGDFEDPYTVTNKVKHGRIKQVKEHKALGTWFNEKACYGINIAKKKEKLPYMISTTKKEASPMNIGAYTIDGRLNLAEVVVIPSILYNAEAYHVHKAEEIKELERVQHKILTGILEVPTTTPYYPLLMEIGWWTMEGRLAYKKLMLYHNITTSDNKRVVKNMIGVQKKLTRPTTWYASIRREMRRYGIDLIPEEVLKSRWKKHVKQKITEKMETEIRTKCSEMTKARTIKNDTYGRKEYITTTNFNNAKKILKTRMHMSKLPGNYKGSGEGICPLCEVEKGNLEHYFQCRYTRQLVDVWDARKDDLGSLDTGRMKVVSNFVEKVEMLLEPMTDWRNKKREDQ